MSNQHTSSSREAVLETVMAMPNITAGRIADRVGLSTRRVLNILVDLKNEGLVGWEVLPPVGTDRSPRRGYFVGQRKAPSIPAAWDVLAHFFGRIAAEPAAA